MSERQAKIDRLDIRESIKSMKAENAMDHDTINLRLDRMDQLIGGLIKLQSEIDRLIQENGDLKKRFNEVQILVIQIEK